MTLELLRIGASVAQPETYMDPVRISRAFKALRERSPVHWVETSGFRPFWAITRHADIIAIEQSAQRFLAAPRTILFNELAESAFVQLTGKTPPVRPLTHMDDPEHRVYRAITQAFFAPANIQKYEKSVVVPMAQKLVDELSHGNRVYDFADIAARFPLGVIMTLIGVPISDLAQILVWTRDLLGVDDPNRRTKKDPFAAIESSLVGFRDYFDRLAKERRKRPRDDIATLLANAKIGGKSIPDFERISYFIILSTAGHDTTSFAITGGLHAFIEFPDQLEKFKYDPSLLVRAVDEILRWTSPVRHFMRTARADCEIGEARIRAGDSLALFFISGNRDEQVFAHSNSFVVTRNPNPQIAFGSGPHHCLGHHLAKMEIRILFKSLMERLDQIECAGTPVWTSSNFVGGIRSLPIRCRRRSISERRQGS